MKRSTLVMTLCAALLGGASQALAVHPLLKCLQARHNAAAKYSACQQKAFGAYVRDPAIQAFALANGKCTAKYAATWSKLQKIGVAPCVGSRFVDQGDGTVLDNLTTLVWEKKQDLDGVPMTSNVHDADNSYSWGFAADGSVFTTFLRTLNTSPGCFAGKCDWRLPTAVELETIRDLSPEKPYGCVASPCIEPSLGPAPVITGWSSTEVLNPELVWMMFPGTGEMFPASKLANGLVARAVRGGL